MIIKNPKYFGTYSSLIYNEHFIEPEITLMWWILKRFFGTGYRNQYSAVVWSQVESVISSRPYWRFTWPDHSSSTDLNLAHPTSNEKYSPDTCSTSTRTPLQISYKRHKISHLVQRQLPRLKHLLQSLAAHWVSAHWVTLVTTRHLFSRSQSAVAGTQRARAHLPHHLHTCTKTILLVKTNMCLKTI